MPARPCEARQDQRLVDQRPLSAPQIQAVAHFRPHVGVALAFPLAAAHCHCIEQRTMVGHVERQSNFDESRNRRSDGQLRMLSTLPTHCQPAWQSNSRWRCGTAILPAPSDNPRKRPALCSRNAKSGNGWQVGKCLASWESNRVPQCRIARHAAAAILSDRYTSF
jgi:hypothetical protein